MSRKTVDVDSLRIKANGLFAINALDQSFRAGVAAIVESVLFETGNYKGYSYLHSELTEDGFLKADYDSYRRFYH